MSERSDKIAKAVSRKAMRYLHRNRVPLGFEATQQDVDDALKGLADRLEKVEVRNLFPAGPVRDGLNDLYLRKLAAAVFAGLMEAERGKLDAHEDAVRPPGMRPGRRRRGAGDRA